MKDIIADRELVLQTIEETGSAIFLVDRAGTLVLANSKACRLAGGEPSALAGRTLAALLPAVGGLKDAAAVGNGQECELDGRPHRVRLRALSLRGEPLTLIVADDLDEEKSGREAVEFVRNVLEGVADGIYVTDAEGKTLFLNKACCDITGLEQDKVLGKNVRELVDQGMILESSTLAVLKSQRSETILQKTLSGKTVLVSGKPVYDPGGKVHYIVSSTRDITELNHLRNQLEKERMISNYYFSELMTANKVVSYSQDMGKILELATHVAKTDSTVLVTGESGVGKDVVCKFIHNQSPRKNKAFIKINCAAIPEHLLESELFGYEGGAFSGAKKGGKPGLVELADKGTLFLDEIGELPLGLQTKLLQVLQEKTFISVGGVAEKTVDIRVLAATNRDLKELVKQGKYRQELYYRLNVVPIHIPPLRARADGIPHLAYHFLSRLNQKYGLNKVLGAEIVTCLQAYDWPGNIRELENVIEQMVVISQDDLLTPEHLPIQIRTQNEAAVRVNSIMPLAAAIEELETQLVVKAYNSTGSTHKAAKLLGVSQPTIVRKLKKAKLIHG